MKVILKYLVFVIALFALSTCKKYDEGGYVHKRIKNLFGKNDDGAKKSWKLKLYEVNGIDSTQLIQGVDKYIDDSNNFIKFSIGQSKSKDYFANTIVYNLLISVDKKAKLLSIGSGLNDVIHSNDSTQCFLESNTIICQRNIFNPEKNRFAEWEIKKLTSDELIITKQLNNNYKIILTN